MTLLRYFDIHFCQGPTAYSHYRDSHVPVRSRSRILHCVFVAVSTPTTAFKATHHHDKIHLNKATNISLAVSTYTERIRLHIERSSDPIPTMRLHTEVLETHMDKFTSAKFGVLAVVLMKSNVF